MESSQDADGETLTSEQAARKLLNLAIVFALTSASHLRVSSYEIAILWRDFF